MRTNTEPARLAVIARVAEHLVARRVGHPLRVAVDGVTAAGKTTFADELAAATQARGRRAIRLSMDGFHHPRAHRYRQGRDSAAGYYRDAYDFEAFARLVLEPLGPAGSGRFVPRVIDLASDEPAADRPVAAESDAILLVDGSFLQRAELAARWDEVIYLDAAFEAARRRGVTRDADAFGGAESAEAAYRQRYHAAGQLYLDEVDPAARASILIEQNDVRHPVLRRLGGLPVA